MNRRGARSYRSRHHLGHSWAVPQTRSTRGARHSFAERPRRADALADRRPFCRPGTEPQQPDALRGPSTYPDTAGSFQEMDIIRGNDRCWPRLDENAKRLARTWYSARFERPNRYRVESTCLTSCLAQTGLKTPSAIIRDVPRSPSRVSCSSGTHISIHVDMSYARARTQA